MSKSEIVSTSSRQAQVVSQDQLALAHPSTLVALSAGEMPQVQQDLQQWCLLKMRALGQEYKELRENLTSAERHKWKTSGLKNAVRRTKQRIQYYQRIKAAVAAGYVIVPNFNVDVIAVRVQREQPRQTMQSWKNSKLTKARAELLPLGEGRYVSERQAYDDLSYMVSDPANPGQEKKKELYKVSGYVDELELPLTILKPQVVQATERALALRIFDRLGIVKGTTRSDPIVVGQIIDPKDYKYVHSPKCVSFFVAWWLDMETL